MRRVGGSSKKLLSFLRTFPSKTRGFTSIELVIVIMVLSILTASIIVKNPFSISDYSSIAADQLIADIRYVQMKASGIGNNQRISFSNNSSQYTLQDGLGNSIEVKKLPGNVKFISNNFLSVLRFDSLGEPYYVQSGISRSCSLTATGCSIVLEGNLTIMVHAVTGQTCKYDLVNDRCL